MKKTYFNHFRHLFLKLQQNKTDGEKLYKKSKRKKTDHSKHFPYYKNVMFNSNFQNKIK